MLTKILSRLGYQKALDRSKLRHPGRSIVYFGRDRTPLTQIANDIGDGTGADVLTSPIRWLQRAAIEAPLQVLAPDGEPVENSDAQAILDRPNPFYDYGVLSDATVWDLSTDGNAYWIIAANQNERAAELWWAPAATMEPWWPSEPTQEQIDNGEAYIQRYKYKVDGREIPIEVDSVIHFRQGVDPTNTRKGLSPLKGLLREIWTDNEAADFTASLLKRGGVPGVVISPRPATVEGVPFELGPEEIEAAKAKIDTGATRTQRGSTIGFTGPVEVKTFGFDPNALDLSALRNVPEERVCAALGVSAATVGFGTGLEQTKVGATMRELDRGSYRNGVVPLWRIIERGINNSELLSEGEMVKFDRSEVEALQEDASLRSARILDEVKAGVRTRGEARKALGLEEQTGDDVYLMSFSTVAVPAGTEPEVIDVTQRAVHLLPEQKHTPSLIERQIIEDAPRASTPRSVARYVRAVYDIVDETERRFMRRLVPVFNDLGRAAESVARQSLGIATRRSDSVPLLKQDEDDALFALLANALADAGEQLSLVYSKTYAESGDDIAAAISNAFGIEFVLPDGAQLAIMREGGVRRGLVDLDQQTKDALFDALASAREEGLAGENLARRIRERITAGPWRDVETRARVIARTEGAHAANTASIEAARGMDGTEHMMVHDNRTGFDDETCAGIDGTIVTIEEADQLGLAHPNCTRSFTPVNAVLLEEMGVSI